MTAADSREWNNIAPNENLPGPINTGNQTYILAGVIACFILSGFAALLYQTAWLRQFSITFGTSELAVATVLAAYMGGLAAGAAIAEKWVGRLQRPILVYGLLEAGIAVTALATPLLLDLASFLYAAVLGGQPEVPTGLGLNKSIFYLVVAFIVLALPTGFMGATLPFLTRYAIHSNSQIGPRIAALYSSNTLGAVIGTVVTAFLLLPNLGLGNTVLVGVAINFLVFVIAALLARQVAEEPIDGDASVITDKEEQPAIRFFATLGKRLAPGKTATAEALPWILPLILASGITSFSYEVLWTRLLNHVLGGSIFAFATMLATFLTGIALGSAFATRFANSRQQAARTFAVAQCGIAIGSILVYFSIDQLMPDSFDFTNRIFFAASVLLPSTLFIGATFPLAVRILTADHHIVGNSTAKVYSWNTVGGIIGSVMAGFWLIPALDYSGAIYLLVFINLALAVLAVLLILRKPGLALLLLVCSGVAMTLFQPQRPEAVIHASYMNKQSHTNYQQEGSDFYYGVGRSATILMRYDSGGFYRLLSNGLNEARVVPRGYPPVSQQSANWLTALPTLLLPNAKEMLVVGFGGGIAVESVVPTIEQIDVIELEAEVIEANRTIAERRYRDPFKDPRLNVIHNDARGALTLTDKRYDIVVSQPSHPWTAGASHLYTSEFAQIVSDHLTDDGIFLQWIYAPFIDGDLLKSIAATLKETFPHVNLYQHRPGTLHFIASKQPLSLHSKFRDIEQTLERQRDHYALLGGTGIEDVLLALTLDDAGMTTLARDAKPNTDDNNALAMLANVTASEQTAGEVRELLAQNDPLPKLLEEWNDRINSGFLFARMLDQGFTARAARLIKQAPTANRLFGEALLDLRQGKSELARKKLLAAAASADKPANANSLLLKINKAEVLAGGSVDTTAALLASISDAEQSVIKAWSLKQQRQWNELEGLDTQFAAVPHDSPWYSEAAQLRGLWRLHNDGPEQAALAREAMEIVDRALVLANSDIDLYLLRFLLARSVEDTWALVETSVIISRFYQQQYQAIKAAPADLRKREITLLQEMAGKLAGNLAQFRYPTPELQKRAETVYRDMRKLANAGG